MSTNECMDLQDPGMPSTVFLIDDDPSARRGLARLIQAAGYAVTTFGSAQEFLASGLNEAPGCMVLDIRMPDGDGLATLEKLRAKKILVRWFSHPEIQDYLRISIGSEEEMETFLRVVRRVGALKG